MRKKSVVKKIAMGLIAVCNISLAGCGTGASAISTGSIAGSIIEAQYPEMAQYPATDGWEYNEIEYKAWWESRKAQEPESTDYQEGITEFCRETIPEFLGGANGKNRSYSPLNIYMALAMLAETTAGNTQEQLLTLLHTDTLEELRTKAKTVWNANYCDDGTVTSLLASSIWLDDSLVYNKKVLETLAETYYASSFSGKMGSEEYNQSLQEWINAQTGGMLEEQAAGVKLDPLTVFALATTVNYQAKWGKEFNASKTEEGSFYTDAGEITCEFMHQGGSNIYYWGEKFSAISRHLQNSGNMLLILPDEGVNVEELLTDEEALDFMLDYRGWKNSKNLIVNQSVPKFDVVSEFDFREALKNLGVTDICESYKANFTPLTAETEVYLQQAKHATRVKIDEEGCMAAAFTVMASAGSSMPPEEEIDFVLNRPFLFVLNGQDGQPLFIGIVNQP